MLLERYPSLKDFYWAKEKIRGLYRQASRGEATKLVDNIIFNLKTADDGELIKLGNIKPLTGADPEQLR